MNHFIKPLDLHIYLVEFFLNRFHDSVGTKMNFWRHSGTMRNTGVAPTNLILSSLSSSLFLRAVGKSLSLFQFCSLCVQAPDLTKWLSITGQVSLSRQIVIPRAKPLVFKTAISPNPPWKTPALNSVPAFYIERRGKLSTIPHLFWISSQIPH